MGRYYDEKQQNILAGFYKELFSYGAADVAVKMLTVVMEGILILLVWCASFDTDWKQRLGLIILSGCYSGIYSVMPYVSFNENSKQASLLQKLKYLPVSLREVKIFCMRKFLKIKLPGLIIMLAGNVLFALIGGVVSVRIFAYPLLVGFCYPFLMSMLLLCFTKK